MDADISLRLAKLEADVAKLRHRQILALGCIIQSHSVFSQISDQLPGGSQTALLTEMREYLARAEKLLGEFKKDE